MKVTCPKKAAGFTLVEIMIVVLIIGILLAIAIPNFVQARESSRCKACIANLKQIDSAVQQYMMDNKLSAYTATNQSTTGASIVALTTYIRSTPACPEGGFYSTGDGTTSATTSSAGRPGCWTASAGSTPTGTGTNVHQLP